MIFSVHASSLSHKSEPYAYSKEKKVLFKIDYLQESGGCLSKILTGYKLIIKSPFVFIFSKKEEVNLFIILISLNIFESYLKKKLDQSLTTYVKVSEKLK